MKKILLVLSLFIINSLCTNANDFPNLRYKNIKLNDKISYNKSTNIWSQSVNLKSGSVFTKVKGFGDTYDYYDSNQRFVFSTGCQYEFIYNNRLIGYSNDDLKFYEIKVLNENVYKVPIKSNDIKNLFPDYQIILLSDFNKNTNAYKIKKHLGELKILLYNDLDNKYTGYYFSSGNAKIRKYDLSGFLSVNKPGMIEFAPNGSYSKNYPHYVLLVR